MPEFLELLPPGNALDVLLMHLPPVIIKTETVILKDAFGRIIAKPVIATEPLPAFPRSTVDGYAVRARDTFGASDTLPAYLSVVAEVPMGKKVNFSLEPAQAALIHTGGMLPDRADAVVMLEHTQLARPGEIEVQKAVAVGENILQVGEDIQPGQEALPAGRRLRSADIGSLAALGILQVEVAIPPRVGILSSGDEVIPPDKTPDPGQVRDINSYSLAALVEESGGHPVLYGILPDRADVLKEAIKRALHENDIVVITAGSSASTRDLTSKVINELGVPGVLVHGIHVRPGKPTILAVCDGKAVIGLPGNPVSALVIARLFVKPLVERLLGLREPSGFAVMAHLTVNIASQAGREEWVPTRLIETGDGYLAEPIFYKSNLIFSLAKAHGLIYIPSAATGLAAGDLVQVHII